MSAEINKMGNEAIGSALTDEEAQEVERLLHGLVSMSHNAAMEFMKTNQARAAGRVLRQCAAIYLKWHGAAMAALPAA